MTHSNGNGGPRNARTILESALAELMQREENLQPFVDELEDTRRAIKTLEKALGQPKAKAATKPGNAPSNSRQDVLDALGNSIDPLTRTELAGRMPGGGRGLHLKLKGMLTDGMILVVDEVAGDPRYGLPVPEPEAA